MFSGITQGLSKVIALDKHPALLNYTIELPSELLANLKIGDSVAVNGVCQTVVKIENNGVSFQAIQETLDKTTLGSLTLNNNVSVERSLRYGDDIGGHEVSGHVYGTGTIVELIKEEGNLSLIIQCDVNWMKYIISKGFIAVDGSSLTIGKTIPEKGQFYLHLIPETLRLTNFSHKKVGDKVNIELDSKTKTIVETVERLIKSQ